MTDIGRAGNRSATRVVRGQATSDGAGVNLTRMIGMPQLDMLDPFLLLDSIESDDPDDYIAGFPAHPHRGFETVTYILAGKMRHKDSTGREGVIEAGGVQWMTAGRGIIHSEMPEQTDGLLKGFQLWVNLPSDLKMVRPQYREFPVESIPLETRSDGASVRVIAGATSAGTDGPVLDVYTDPLFLDIELTASASFSEPLPKTHNTFIYVIAGDATVVAAEDGDDRKVGERHLAVLEDGERVTLVAGDEGAKLLLVAAHRIEEPVARYGPFVMNTQQELLEAAEDYRSGRFLEDA